MEDVMMELDMSDDDQPVMPGSNDEFDDMVCTENERDEWDAVDDYELQILTESNRFFPISYSAMTPGDLPTGG